MVGDKIFLFLICILLIGSISAQLKTGYEEDNSLVVNLVKPTPATNTTTGSQVFNQSEYWITDEGLMDNVPDIDYSDFGGSSFWDADVDLGAYDLTATVGTFDTLIGHSVNVGDGITSTSVLTFRADGGESALTYTEAGTSLAWGGSTFSSNLISASGGDLLIGQDGATIRTSNWDVEADGVYTGTGFGIGANVLTTSEFAFLDGQDQAVNTSSSPTFTNLGVGITGSPSAKFSVGGAQTDAAYFFYDNPKVGDAEHGQEVRVYRNASEGVDYMGMYINKGRNAIYASSRTMYFVSEGSQYFSPTTGNVHFQSLAPGNVILFSGSGDGENRYLRQFGWPSGASGNDWVDSQIVGVNNDYQIQTHNTDADLILMPDSGNVGIRTPTPSYPLEVNEFVGVSNISIYALGNVSATGYITRTSIFDKLKGNALDFIQDVDYYLTDGKIDHEKFYGYAGEFEITDYSRPEIEQYIDVECDSIYHDEISERCFIENDKIVCKEVEEQVAEEVNCTRVIKERTIYPHKKLEKGVSLDVEINVLRQATYEQQQIMLQQNQTIQDLIKRIEVLENHLLTP